MKQGFTLNTEEDGPAFGAGREDIKGAYVKSFIAPSDVVYRDHRGGHGRKLAPVDSPMVWVVDLLAEPVAVGAYACGFLKGAVGPGRR